MDNYRTLEDLDLNFTYVRNLLPAENTVPVGRSKQEHLPQLEESSALRFCHT